MEGLERVWLRRRLRRLHRAKLAAPRARVPQQHDGAGAPVPALPDVGALGLFAHRVQVELFQRGLEYLVLRVRFGLEARSDPKRHGTSERCGQAYVGAETEGETFKK